MDGNISILSVCMQSPNTGPTTLSLPAALPIWAGRARGIPLEQPPRHVSRLPARVLEVRRPRPTALGHVDALDRKSTRLNPSHVAPSYAVFCLNKKRALASAPAICMTTLDILRH